VGQLSREIDAFIGRLADLERPAHCFNPYNSGDPRRDAIRRENLRLYFEESFVVEPATLLVGEAPGYNGCRWTGIPFTSERQLARGVPGHGLFGSGKGYRWTSGRDDGFTEPSGTILWGIVDELPRLPLLWNAFPLHPHRPGRPLSNRSPGAGELALHAGVLAELATIFGIRRCVALGRKAQRTLLSLGVEAEFVRHPANGGKRACREGLLGLLGREYSRERSCARGGES